MKNREIPLPSLGVDLLSDQTQMRRGSVRVAENVDINVSGTFKRRDGFTTVVAGEGFHSAYTDARGTLVGRGNSLFAIDEALAPSFLLDMAAPGPWDFTVYNGHTYVASRQALVFFPADGSAPRRVGVTPPVALPSLAAHTAGNLTAGTYAVAVSRLDDRGEESPTVALGTIELTAGLRLEGLAVEVGSKYRVYITPPNGDVLYLAAEFDAVFTQYVVADMPDGAPRTSQNLRAMPAGDFVRGHAGRLYVARDDTLYFSEPLRPHLTDARSGFIQFVGDIRFVEPVEGGLYIGDDRGVWWLDGMDPSKSSLRRVSKPLAVRRSSLVVSSVHMAGQGDQPVADVAVWLSTEGYMIGRPDGGVTPLHPDRVALAADLEGRSVFVIRDGVKQIVTLIAATKEATQAFGVALDSTLH